MYCSCGCFCIRSGGLAVPFCFRWRISHFGAALKASSSVCAFLSLPCPVRWPVVTMGRAYLSIRSFVARLLVVPSFEFWRPGALLVPGSIYSPATEILSFFLESFEVVVDWFSSSHCWSLLHWRHLSVFWPASAGDRYLSGFWFLGWRLRSSAAAAGSLMGMDGCLSSPPSGVADGAISCTLNALCIDWNLFPVHPGLF